MDAQTRLEVRRANRNVGGPVVNRKDVGAFLASLRERREKGGRLPEYEPTKPGQKLTEREREENRRQILASKALETLGPDLEESAAATKQRFGLAARQIRDSILGSPAGVYEAGKAVGLDTRDIASQAMADVGLPLKERGYKPSRTKDLGVAMGKQIAEDFRNPEENPGHILLNLFAAASVGAGGASRLGAAGRAAKAPSKTGKRSPAKVVSQTLVRKPSEGGSLLRRPPPGRVEIAPGVHRNLSRNPLAAALQRDRLERQSRHPEGVTGGRVPRILRGRNRAELVGRERRRKEQILTDVDRAEAEGLRKRGRKLSAVEGTAVRTVGERKGVEARILAHRRDLVAIEGKGPRAKLARRRLRDKIALLQEVQRQGLVIDADGNPRFKTGSRMEKLYERAVASTGRREAIIEELGLATREQLVARRAAPGRVIEGATFERTPAQAARREHVREYQQPATTRERPRTEAEAKTRLAALDEAYETTLVGIERQLTGGQPADRVEVARRNLYNLRSKNRRRGRPRMETVRAEVRGMAEDRLARLLEARADDPDVARVAALVEERQRLREALSDPERHFGERRAQTGEFGQARYTVPGKTTRRTFPGRERRPAYERLVGFEETPAGDLYIPYGRRRIKISRAQVGTPQGIGQPRTPQSLTQPFTGRAFQTGRFRDDAVTAIAESELEIVRHRAILRVRAEAVRESISGEDLLALPDRVREHHVPVRVTGKPYTPDTREFLQTIEGKTADGIKLTRKERRELERRGDQIRAWAFPDMDTQQAMAAAAKGEVRFVDGRRLGGLNEPEAIAGGKFRLPATIMDEINSAQQIAILFLKPAYLTPNLLGQSALALIQQGPVAPWNLAKATALYRHLSPEDQAKVRAGIGQGFAQSLDVRGGRFFTPARNVMAQKYSKVLDSPFRWPAFLHEARVLGYDTPQKIRQLLNDTSKRDDMVEVFKRTRDAMIDYSDLGPWEQRLIRRVIFFYPWVRGSSVYTARFARDRPVVSAGIAQLGAMGTEKAERELGGGPWYGRGTFKAGGTEERPQVVNPASAALFDSPVRMVEAIGNLIQGKPRQAGQTVSDFLSPAAQLPFQLERPHDPLGGYELPLSEALKRQYVENLPQPRLARELREPTEDRDDVLYPTSRAGAFAKFGVGTIFPRPLNRAEWNERARSEAREKMGPGERAAADVFDERRTFFEAAKELAPDQLQGGKLPPDLRDAFKRKAAVNRLRARIAADTDPGVDREYAKFKGEVELLKSWKLIPTSTATQALTWAETAPADEVKSWRSTISRKYFEPAYLERILQARHYLEERGATLSN